MNTLSHSLQSQCSPFEDQAAALLEVNLSPIPITPGEKKPAVDEWESFADKLPHELQIKLWQTRFRDAGVGTPLGKSLGNSEGPYIVAIDIDQDRYVEPVKALLFGDDTTEKPVYVAKRGSKGETIFAISNERLNTRRFKNDAGMAIEFLSIGAQTVLPPTVHPHGMAYKWISDETLLTANLRELPLVTKETVQALEALVKPKEAANENAPLEPSIIYHGNGQFSGVEMIYPGNVNDLQNRMAAVAARWNYLNEHDDDEGRKLAVEGMVKTAFEALDKSELNEEWDRDKQWKEAASQYDRAMVKGPVEWEWDKDRTVSEPAQHTSKLPILNIICPAEWAGKPVPPRKWIVTGWVPHGAVTALYGDGGMGKSLLSQQLMTACATGKRWLGLETKGCSVLGLFCEDDPDELWRRQDKINAAYDIDLSSLKDMHFLSRVAEDNALMTFGSGSRGKLSDLWRALIREAKEREVDLVIIDTAADTFGGNENVRTEVRQFLADGLGRLAREANCAVVMCAHPSRAGLNTGSGDGGSTAWNNSVRSRLYLKKASDKDGKSDKRILSRQKANYAPLSKDVIELEWKEGVFARIAEPTAVELMERQTMAQEAFLARLDALTKQERVASSSINSSNFAPRIMSEGFDDGYDVTKDELAGAMTNLMDVEIRELTEGPPSKQTRKLVRLRDNGNDPVAQTV